MKSLSSLTWALVQTSVASAATVDLGAINTRSVLITGAATITSFGTGKLCEYLIRFNGALTLTHNATSLILPGGANITTAAGDTCMATSDTSGNWRIWHYQRASGKAVVGPASTDISDSTATGRSVLTAGTAAAGATALGLGTASSPTFTGLTLSATITSSATDALTVDASGGERRPWTAKRSASVSVYQYVTATSIGVYDTTWGLVWSYDGTTFSLPQGLDVPGASTFGFGTFSVGLTVSGGSITSSGANAAYFFQDRLNSAVTYALYATQGSIRFYNGSADIFTLTSSGDGTFAGGVTATSGTFSGPVRHGSYTVATLPAGTAGQVAYVSNARKVGEATGAGTGVMAYYSGAAWRRLSDDTAVAA